MDGRGKKTKACEQCGNQFAPYRGRFDVSKFCSMNCKHQYAKVHKPKKGYQTQNVSGENHPRWKPRLTFTCKHCAKVYQREKWIAQQATNTNDFCSVSCRAAYRQIHLSGHNAPDYVGGQKTRRGRGWLQTRRVIVDQQHGCCKRCGKHVGKSLPVHHIKPFREFEFETEANALENLVGLCQSCHMKEEPRPYRRGSELELLTPPL